MLSETQLSKRASALPIEEIYTDVDVNPETDYDARRGYTFDYPARWLNDPSEFKRIGIRWLDVVPTSHTFNLGMRIYKTCADLSGLPEADLNAETPFQDWNCTSRHEKMHTFSWEEAKPWWDKYGIGEQEIHKQIIIEGPNIVVKQELSRTPYYNDEGFVCLTLVKNELQKQVTTLRFDGVFAEEGAPPPHALYVVLEETYTSKATTTEEYYETDVDNISVTTDYNLEEVMQKICTDFNTYALKCTKYTDEHHMNPAEPPLLFTMFMMYNYKLARLTLYCRDESNTFYPFTFRGGSETDVIEIAKFFNQPIDDDAYTNRMLFYRDASFKPTELTLTNVWNRKRIFIHSSFSETKRGIIGMGGDWYDTPSKFFHSPTNTSEFNIWFTTDGVHVIKPLYCEFAIELCYLLNYKTVKFT